MPHGHEGEGNVARERACDHEREGRRGKLSGLPEEEEVRRRGDEHIAEEQEEPLPPATEVAKADVIGHASDESKNRTSGVQREGLGRDPPMTVGIDSVLTLFPRRLWPVRVPAVTQCHGGCHITGARYRYPNAFSRRMTSRSSSSE